MDGYLTTKELSARIKLIPDTIRNMVCRGQFKLGTHYVKPGPRKLLFLGSGIESWLHGRSLSDEIPDKSER